MALLLIVIELLVIVVLAIALYKLMEFKKRVPAFQKQMLDEIIEIRQEFKKINERLEMPPPEPFEPYELGRLLGGLTMRIFLLRKASLFHIAMILIKHRSRLMATVFR